MAVLSPTRTAERRRRDAELVLGRTQDRRTSNCDGAPFVVLLGFYVGDATVVSDKHGWGSPMSGSSLPVKVAYSASGGVSGALLRRGRG